MAWENYGWVWNVVGLQGSEYLVLHCLANEADSRGCVQKLKIQTIMQRCNISRASAEQHLRNLERKKMISRKKRFHADGSQGSNEYHLNKKRYFPDGTYNDSIDVWKQMLEVIERYVPARISRGAFACLSRVDDAYLQKNARTLYLVTETDVYEETLIANINLVKEAIATLDLPIRRVEVFRKPYLK